MRDRIGRFRVLRKLGEGGMGAVFAARDEQLDRDVAIKVIAGGAAGDESRERVLREARAAARVNHPRICQIYEIGEADGEPFLAMELLEGEPLSAAIARGPLAASDAVRIAGEVLEGLEALHRRGVVHRDLKPANIFLTPHGTKVLDFGLARPGMEGADRTELQITRPGTLVGTPRYMAPEQWEGAAAGPAADLFAAGAILYEMLAGRPAFEGTSLPELCRAVLERRPPALAGAGPVAAIDRVIHRALQKRPADRHSSAEAMAAELRSALSLAPGGEMPRVRAVTRLVVLPFRLLRPDPDTDFLAFSLPDAVAASLAGLQSLAVRSTLAASRFATENPDLRAIAREADVDAVVLGTLLRAGEAVRVSVQLVEAPAGTLRCTKTVQAPLKDLFQLQDELARQVVEALAIPLSPREDSLLHRDVPANPRAYEIYLRANQINVSLTNTSMLRATRDLYKASTDEDPNYAPAWARLGRLCRILAKYDHGDRDGNLRQAEAAFQAAFRLNPDLPLAHNLYTNFEVEDLGRPREAVRRLVARARTGAADANLFAGLSMALRFCGLVDAAIAADGLARRLDPNVRTGVQYALWVLGRYPEAAERDTDDPPILRIDSLHRSGRDAEALALLREIEVRRPQGVEAIQIAGYRAYLEGRTADFAGKMGEVLGRFRDPEGLFFISACLADGGLDDLAIAALRRAVEGSYWNPAALRDSRWPRALRERPDFAELLGLAEARHAEAAADFAAAGGPALLGLSARIAP